ncbi:glycosyltransferase family 4 protein [Candidatus Neomarinimicrobiota bacterium]
MKKILFILHYPPPIHGAAIVGQFIRESEFINKRFKCKYLKLGTALSLTDGGKISLHKILRYLLLLNRTIYCIIRFKPTLVYMTLTSEGFGFYKDIFVVCITKILGCKLVYHLHNKGVANRQDKMLDNFLYKIVFKNAEVILLSYKLYSDINKYVYLNNVHICPNGIPTIKIDNNQKNQSFSKDTTRILFLSNLMKEKGIYILLEACKILKERKIMFMCNIIGDEGDVSKIELKDYIKTNALEKYICYIGPLYNSDKYDYYISADVFAFPTLNECFGLVLLEAMQFSLPVVSVYEGGIPDMVKDGQTGFLIKKNDPIELANKLEILIKDKDLRNRMGKTGRKKYLDNFTINHFEERLTNILDKIINKN